MEALLAALSVSVSPCGLLCIIHSQYWHVHFHSLYSTPCDKPYVHLFVAFFLHLCGVSAGYLQLSSLGHSTL
jgi:hypothetical protein